MEKIPEEIVGRESVNQSRKNEPAIAKNLTMTTTALDRDKIGKMEWAASDNGLPWPPRWPQFGCCGLVIGRDLPL